MGKLRVGVIGATGMVGQRFITLLCEHPFFTVTALAAGQRSAGKTYQEAVQGRWQMTEPIPDYAKNMTVFDATLDIDLVADAVDFVFCAVNLPKAQVKELEEAYAKKEVPVISNNSAHRGTPDVPMVIPEINAHHLGIIAQQKQRLGTERGFIAVKPNCSIQSYVPALTPLLFCGIESVAVTTYQAISGAGKTFESMPEIIDNIIPFISGEEEKSEQEPMKIWGSVGEHGIIPATSPV
ncbi:MAG: aspartate-semialdehyde dehydrogenase, partial [Clostridia bacterium]|nr:aspartate-semialdehyde dehydrogenase [Clostridia bacterium]